jgi:hypothetical protein
MYYFILALVEIGIFLSDNWKGLTSTAIASGIGIIIGKRMGIRIAVKYFMKTFRLERKSADQQQLEHHEKEIVKMGGTPWNVSMLQSAGNGLDLKRLRISLKGGLLARFAKCTTPQHQTYQSLRRNQKMSKWIKPDKLMIVIGMLITASNEYFGWALDTENVAAFFFMLFTFFKQQEIIKVVRYAYGLPVAFKINSTKLVFTVLGVLIVALDQVKGMGLGMPEILAIATFVSGYNIKEGNEDVKKSEAEAQGNQFH